MPNDLILVDDDGTVVIPSELVSQVVEMAVKQERLEGWIMSEVECDAELPGLYPPNVEN